MKILIVEDDEKIARLIADGLTEAGYLCKVATDGVQGLELAANAVERFDVVVLDLLLPKMDGFGVLTGMRSREIRTPVLMLSARDSVDDRIRGLSTGADDYLVKPFAFDELLARLRAMVRRARTNAAAAEPTRLVLADLALDRLTRRVQRGTISIELQPKEFALLEYFLCNVGQTLTKTMILAHVWRWNFDPQTNVVDVMVFRLRNKLDRGHELKLIHTLRGLGYVLRADQ